MTAGYESILFLLAWYSIAITLFTAILSPVFFSDCISFFSMFAKGILSLFQKFVAGADSFGQLSSGISNSIISGIVYWLIVSIVMGILFIITGLLIIGTGYQVGKIYRKYCWDIISIMVVIMSTAICLPKTNNFHCWSFFYAYFPFYKNLKAPIRNPISQKWLF